MATSGVFLAMVGGRRFLSTKSGHPDFSSCGGCRLSSLEVPLLTMEAPGLWPRVKRLCEQISRVGIT
ncbi:hypothetical protein E2562_027312 [Oryza meyeriana var. granulata]|uniref:Uncharacterized protein n=1 Tax=Oryza meyeriana var. granulata TaxID=110450 RepID=A0A6G1C0C9_9ORYZ|nr:hypothetical protein E2562_027312 [Oryza meyeriana var. granulata]